MAVTFAGKGGNPYLTEEAARLSFCDSSATGNVTYTDPVTGQSFLSQREMEQARIEREKRGW